MRRRRIGATSLGLAAAVAATGCRAPSPSFSDVDAGLRGLGVRTVLLRDRVSLHSPFGVADSERLADVADDERSLVAGALGVADERAVPVLLRPAPTGEGTSLVDRVLPSEDGARGFASTSGAVAVSVAVGTPDAPGPPPFVDRGVLRHELTHALVRRAGLDLEPWLNEATATVVAARLRRGDGRLAVDPLPAYLLRARSVAPSVRLDDVLDWRPDRSVGAAAADEPGGGEVALYDLAASLLRFELERGDGRGLLDVVRDLAARSRSSWRAEEAAWKAWLDELSLADRLAAQFGSDVEAVRAEATSRALEAAERFGADAFGARFDAAVVDRLVAAPTDLAATRILLTHRAERLASAEIERLEASGAAMARVVALALRKRRGEEVPDDVARAALDRLAPEEAGFAFPARLVLTGSAGE